MVSLAALVLSAICCSAAASPLRASPRAAPAALSHTLGRSAAEGFRVNMHLLDANPDSNLVDDPAKQLSPSTQSFLSTLGTALGPIVGAIVGPLLTNIGQNLSAGSGAQAINQLQQAAQVAASQQQHHHQSPAGGAPVTSTSTSTESTPRPAASRPDRPDRVPPPRRPSARPGPGRPGSRPPASTPTPTPRPQSYDAFVLDVPGRGPFLFLMTPNATEREQSAAIKQAQQQASQLFGASSESSPQWALPGVVGALMTPKPLVTKPTSAGPLPIRPGGSPLPSYHSLLEAEEGTEEVAVADELSPEPTGQVHISPAEAALKEDENSDDFSSTFEDSEDSLTQRLFPEIL